MRLTGQHKLGKTSDHIHTETFSWLEDVSLEKHAQLHLSQKITLCSFAGPMVTSVASHATTMRFRARRWRENASERAREARHEDLTLTSFLVSERHQAPKLLSAQTFRKKIDCEVHSLLLFLEGEEREHTIVKATGLAKTARKCKERLLMQIVLFM